MFKIELGLPFMVPDFMYKFQIICLHGIQKPNVGLGDMSKT